MNRLSLFLLFLCLFLIFMNLAESKKKSRKHKHGDGDDEGEEEEEDDDTYECLDCKGVNCTNSTAEDCLFCFTLTSSTSELRGCIDDKALAKSLEDDSCVDGIISGISGNICYCEEDLCNKHDYTKSGITAYSCLVLVIFAVLLSAHTVLL